tara:strand:- start:1336 stop:1644 length:309 start_codon:yes stop_codon:yes gene_type:complete
MEKKIVYESDVLLLAEAKSNQTIYDEATTITIANLRTALDEIELNYILASDCVNEWYETEAEINGFMASAISMGLAYDAVYFELLDQDNPIELTEEYYFNYI